MGRAIKEKRIFLKPFFQRAKILTAIKLEGGEGLGLNGSDIKRRTIFFAASLTVNNFCISGAKVFSVFSSLYSRVSVASN